MSNIDLSAAPQSTTTPTAHLAATLPELEAALTQRPASGTGYLLRNIETWINHREKPFLELEMLQQGTLKARLISVLDPRRIELAEPVSPHNGETQAEANAKTRAKALDILIAIDGQQIVWWKEKVSGAIPPANATGMSVHKFLQESSLDLQTLQAYHSRLIKWPRFIDGMGRFYGEALSTLSADAEKRGQAEMVSWIDETAKGDLARANATLRASGAKPARAPGG